MQGFEVSRAEAADHRHRQFDLDDLAQLVHLLAVQVLEVQVVAQGATGRFGAGFIQVRAAAGAGAGVDQAFDLKGLERFTRRALGALETFHQLALGGQTVARAQRVGDDGALDRLDYHIGKLLAFAADRATEHAVLLFLLMRINST
ncbi:hypothetical protein D3C85_1547120 [compost metagenome]